jgi:hypothetical protein
VGINFSCDICDQTVEASRRKPVGLAGLNDVCSYCEEVLRKTVELMKISPWDKKVVSIHQQMMEAIRRSKE